MATTQQIKMIRGILGNIGIKDEADKKDFLREFTEGRTDSVSAMTHREINQLVTAYQGKSGRDKMISNFLRLAHEMLWELPGGKVDMKRINDWCIKYSTEHVPLDQIPTHQLGKVLATFKKVHEEFLNGF